MKGYIERESLCEFHFQKSGNCWHLWTSEDFPVIFASKEDFIAGMNIMGIVARLCPKVKVYTFELMSNHIHITASGALEDLLAFFELFKKLLSSYFKGGRYENSREEMSRAVDLSSFTANVRAIESLSDLRNVIAYNNRNGYIISPDHTPFSYPWGANRYYFNPDAKYVASHCSEKLGIKEKHRTIHSHIADNISPIMKVYGCACPYDFCAISDGELMFRSPSQYFHSISKSVESYKAIAKDISESIFYTDEELFSAISSLCRNKYHFRISEMDKNTKVEIARIMHYDYNASNKQIARILKLQQNIVDTMFN